MPGVRIPDNVVAVPDVTEAAKDADILIFVLPHQFVRRVCNTLKGKIKQDAIAISLIKGVDTETGKLKLISNVIAEILGIRCSVLMGANLAAGLGKDEFSETTIGCANTEDGAVFKKCLQAPFFRIVVVEDSAPVELCGALKNIVAIAAGIVDGLDYGDNTKAAVIRLGFMEMIKFIESEYPDCRRSTFLESCGIADLITTCYGGRNRRVAEAMARTGKTVESLEEEMLNGQKLQGPPTAHEIYDILKERGDEDKFPTITAVHKICIGELPCSALIDYLKNHPEHR